MVNCQLCSHKHPEKLSLVDLDSNEFDPLVPVPVDNNLHLWQAWALAWAWLINYIHILCFGSGNGPLSSRIVYPDSGEPRWCSLS